MTPNLATYIVAARPVVAQYGEYPSRGSREHAAFDLDIAEALHGVGLPESPAALVAVYFGYLKMVNDNTGPDDNFGDQAMFAVGRTVRDQCLARSAATIADIQAKLVVIAYEMREMSMGGAVYDGVITSIKGMRRLGMCR